MPRLYDRTACVSELAQRNQILQQIDAGRLPCASPEIPNQTPSKKATGETDLESAISSSR